MASTRTLVLSLVVALVFFLLLYDIYRTRSYKKPRQVIFAITGALLLTYLLYTCRSDNYTGE